jgi:RNA polymerase sigma-70 factor (ECF subfamily)
MNSAPVCAEEVMGDSMATPKPQGNITQLLDDFRGGDQKALERLLPQVYDQLHRIAAKYMRRESARHTLQPTALVHEAFLRLVDGAEVNWQNRAHFFAVAANLMRRILVDHAKAKKAAKRGGGGLHVSFDEQMHAVGPASNAEPDVLALDRALKRLAKVDERQARVVELRYFGGLSIEEVADALQASPATIKRDWAAAKLWLFREIEKDKEE